MNINDYKKIKSCYDFSKFKLFETYGILNFNDKIYNNLITNIANDILEDKGIETTIYYKNEEVLKCKQLTYHLTWCNWCKNLRIFYEFANEIDSFVLSRKEFSTVNIISLFDREQLYLNNGALYIKINKLTTKSEIKGIIKHEIKHLYYYLKTNISTDKSNKDILYQETYIFCDDFNFFDILKNYYNDKVNLNELTEIEFKDLLIYCIYYLNLNECRSMIENISYEIENHITNRYLYLKTKQYVKINNIKDFNHYYLIRLSETFAVYMFIYDLLNEYNDTYVKIYNENFKNDFEEIYGVKTLKQFCKLMLKRIDEKIINKTYKIFNYYKNNFIDYED